VIALVLKIIIHLLQQCKSGDSHPLPSLTTKTKQQQNNKNKTTSAQNTQQQKELAIKGIYTCLDV
jgi:hypothetical protein